MEQIHEDIQAADILTGVAICGCQVIQYPAAGGGFFGSKKTVQQVSIIRTLQWICL